MKSHCCSRCSSQSRFSASSLPPAFGCNLARSKCRFPAILMRTTIGPIFIVRCPNCRHLDNGGRCGARRQLLKVCAAAGCRSKKRAGSITSRSMSSWPGSAISTAMECPVCGAPVINSIATQTFGGADMSEEPRTEVLRRRIELYLHCVGEGISTAEVSNFVQQIAEAEDELVMLTAESTFRYDVAAHRSR